MDLLDVRRHGCHQNRRPARSAPPPPDPHSRRHGLSGPGILSMIASRRGSNRTRDGTQRDQRLA